MQLLPASPQTRYSCSFTFYGWSALPKNIETQIRYYVVETIDNDKFDDSGINSDSEFDIDGLDKSRILDKDQFDSLRVNLYQNSSDPVLKELNQASSVQEVFDTIKRCGEQLTAEQSSQAIVTLWDLQKMYGRYGFECSSVSNSQIYLFLEKILNHPVFEKIVIHLENVCEDLDDNAISSTLLYLDRLGLRNDAPLIQKLLMLCLKRYENFSLIALSKLAVYLRAQGFKAYFFQSKILPIMAEQVKNCSSLDELHLITICLYSTKRIISEPLLNDYSQLVKKNLEEGLFEMCNPKIILKVLKFLGYSVWSAKHHLLCRRLMLCIADKVHSLNVQQVMELSYYFQNYLEPREVFHKIQQHSLSLIDESEGSFGKPDLLFLAQYSSQKMRGYFESLIAELLVNKDFLDYIEVIFKTLRHIKTSNVKLCNAFWITALNAVEEEISQTSSTYLGFEDVMLRKVYHRYMYFNNNLGGTYRNFHLEKNMLSMLVEILRQQSGLLPQKIANMSAFIISYSTKSEIPKDIVEKLLQCGPQYSIFDTLILSRGIEINLALNRNNTKRTLMEQITALCRMLDSCTEEHLKTAKSLLDVSSITKAYQNRHGSPRTFLFEKLVNAHLPFLHELNSRLVRDISLCFIRTKYLAPQILDTMAQYILDNQEYVMADTVERVLTCLYNLGYYTAPGDDFFSACVSVFFRESHQMRGLSILQVCLALSKFGHLPAKLIHDVFNLTFLDQLDEEISECYSKEYYPMLVRHMLMELNRAVCIDHPEEKIPWFHEKYCEELLETVPVPNSVYHTEVHQALTQLVGGPDVLRANVKSPYYYLIDFEFLLDKDSHPVPVNEYVPVRWKTTGTQNTCMENKIGYRRIAVLLRKESNYCINSRQLLGRHQMEHRHLEVLGYTVVEVPHFMWYSMAHAAFEDKKEYLKNIIYPRTL